MSAANKTSVAIANFVNVCTASRRILGRIIGSQSPSAQESSMKYWPGRSSSATQFAFMRDPEKRSSDSTRSSAVLLEKERERRPAL